MLPNIHERTLHGDPARVRALIDSVAGPDDSIWPSDRWPAMRLDRSLAAGAKGGHGAIRYTVEDYRPGERIVFRFAERGGLSEGLVGTHRLELEAIDGDRTLLRHVIDARLQGLARVRWPLVIEPLHDALIEDAFDRAATAVGDTPRRAPYSLWVRLLRSAFIWARKLGKAT